jgi:hypothetical protein
MKALFASFAALSLVSVFALPACAPTSDVDRLDDANDDTADISATSRTHVVLRRDTRKCASPMCGGYFVHDVNRKNLNEKYVSGLDFSASDLDSLSIDQVLGAADGEVVLYGKLGPIESAHHTRTFIVTSAWRGMPGYPTSDADTFYSVEDLGIQCFAAPCDSLEATKLNSTKTTQFTGANVNLGQHISEEWLAHRVLDGDALVAGSFGEGQTYAAGTEEILFASQVFLKLPERVGPCVKLSQPYCGDGTVSTYTHTPDRCNAFDQCVEPGACIALAPTCADGYVVVSWTAAPFACSAYTCEPAFLYPEQ